MQITPFSLADINAAHAKVKSGADFPSYIQDLVQLGVKSYIIFVRDGHAVYFGEDGYQLDSEPVYAELPISLRSDKTVFIAQLRKHQQGQTDYFTFCQHCAETGIEKWIVDTKEMTCIYYDLSAEEILMEIIPT